MPLMLQTLPDATLRIVTVALLTAPTRVLAPVVQTAGVVLAKVTSSPELAVALTTVVPPVVSAATVDGEKPLGVMVCEPKAIGIEGVVTVVPTLPSVTLIEPRKAPALVGVPAMVRVSKVAPPGVPVKPAGRLVSQV